jgi:hypothetical protein
MWPRHLVCELHVGHQHSVNAPLDQHPRPWDEVLSWHFVTTLPLHGWFLFLHWQVKEVGLPILKSSPELLCCSGAPLLMLFTWKGSLVFYFFPSLEHRVFVFHPQCFSKNRASSRSRLRKVLLNSLCLVYKKRSAFTKPGAQEPSDSEHKLCVWGGVSVCVCYEHLCEQMAHNLPSFPEVPLVSSPSF